MNKNKKSQSLGILQLKKELMHKESNFFNGSQQFIPFVNQRKLGKLIDHSMNQNNKKQTLQNVTFKNFKKIYNREKMLENVKYSERTRSSQQQDLISHRADWKFVTVDNDKIKQRRKFSSTIRQCCFNQEPAEKVNTPMKFDKIDEDIFKKIIVSKPPQSIKNPEIKTLFRHYVDVCQLNENIRRVELTRRKKF